MNARRATIKEPVPLEDNPEVNENESEDNPEVIPEQEPESEPDPEDGEESEPEDEPEPWHVGAACLTCGNRKPRLTVNWGNGCDQCLVPDED